MTTTSHQQDQRTARRTTRSRVGRSAVSGRVRSRGAVPTRVAAAGRPMRAALLRVPFVVALIAVLGGGVGSVLYLNTKMDESGMRTEQATMTSAQLRLQIEELGRTIADLGATPRLAQEAQAMGLVPAGDAAIMTIGTDGKATLIGTPAPATANAHPGAGR
ncbi:MAG: hypothetical protein BGO26_08635 [Actinobacteria bacterium 69-20]|nr:hypothetical protein [Actinomycetota bacterium]OJV25771.1 MAG: hypothetical protein BGO26_08635 [Actinobacteria bacterium 69-20]